MSDSLIPSFLVSDVCESLRSLTKNEQCEQIAHFFERIAHFFAKTSDLLRKPMSEFPALEPEPPRASNLFVGGRSQIFLIWAFYSPQVLRHTLKFILASGADQR